MGTLTFSHNEQLQTILREFHYHLYVTSQPNLDVLKECILRYIDILASYDELTILVHELDKIYQYLTSLSYMTKHLFLQIEQFHFDIVQLAEYLKAPNEQELQTVIELFRHDFHDFFMTEASE